MKQMFKLWKKAQVIAGMYLMRANLIFCWHHTCINIFYFFSLLKVILLFGFRCDYINDSWNQSKKKINNNCKYCIHTQTHLRFNKLK